MLGEIDRYRKPQTPQIFLAKPDRTIISKLHEAFNIKHNASMLQLNEIEFDLPYDIEVDHITRKNTNIDFVKERYLLRVVSGTAHEWYIINNVHDAMSDDRDTRSIHAFALGYELRDKTLRNYKNEVVNARVVLNEVLAESLWNVDYLDADYELTYRSFDFANTSVLDAVYQIAETFNAILKWNSTSRTISLSKPESDGIDRGLKFSYGHYLRTLGKESNPDEMVTRLKAYGKDGLSLVDITSTGANYIDDFSYFMYPFERDANKMTIHSSHYMSDSLCNALLDYGELVAAKENEFQTLLASERALVASQTEKKNKLEALQNQMKPLVEKQTQQQFAGEMWFEQISYNGSTTVHSTPLNVNKSYIVMCKVVNPSNLQIQLDGSVKSVPANTWTALGKITGSSNTFVHISGFGSSNISLQIATISQLEYDTSGNEAALIDRYCPDHKQKQIDTVKAEIDTINSNLAAVSAQQLALGQLLRAEANFTAAQLQELNQYIIVREFVDDNIIDADDLLAAAKEKFQEWKKPQTIIDIDVVDFLQIVTEQGNWHKLVLGDYVTIEYEKIGVRVKAKIIEISHDFEAVSIRLTIANVKDISDDYKKLEKYIYNSINTTTTVNMEKNKWTKTIYDTGEIGQILERFWNKTTNEINMASNEYVTIDPKGITIIDPADPARFLRATHGALALTRSSGLKYETAITPDGIIAERLMGKILLTNRVVIGDDDGILEITGPTGIITDRCNREVMRLGLVEESPDKFGIMLNRYDPSSTCNPTVVNKIKLTESEGLLIQRQDGTTFENVAWLDLNGVLNAQWARFKNSFITDGAIEGATLKIGSGDHVFKADLNGIYLGNENFEDAPFRVDLRGNAYMLSAHIEDSFVTNGTLIGGSLKIGGGDHVLKVDNKGIYLGNETFANAPFRVDSQGNATISSLLIEKNGKPLLSTNDNTLWLNNLNIDGVNKLTAQQIVTNTIVAKEGFIANLSVNHLFSMGNQYNVGDYADFIDIKNQFARWITAQITSKVQAVDDKGTPLYWKDSNKNELVTNVTPYQAYQYDYSLNEKDGLYAVKRSIFFHGSGASSYPVDVFGAGDGAKQVASGGVYYDSGRAYIEKPADKWIFQYFARTSADLRSMSLGDNGIDILSFKSSVNVKAKDLTIRSEDGAMRIEHSQGSYIEMKANGDIAISAIGNLSLKADGIVTINGSSVYLN